MPNIIEITDFSAPELDIYARLTEVQLLNRRHPDQGMFIAESPKVIDRALNAGICPVSVLVEKNTSPVKLPRFCLAAEISPSIPPSLIFSQA